MNGDGKQVWSCALIGISVCALIMKSIVIFVDTTDPVARWVFIFFSVAFAVPIVWLLVRIFGLTSFLPTKRNVRQRHQRLYGDVLSPPANDVIGTDITQLCITVAAILGIVDLIVAVFMWPEFYLFIRGIVIAQLLVFAVQVASFIWSARAAQKRV